MATYTQFQRSGYFEVKDPEAFRNMVEQHGATLISKKVDDTMLYGYYIDEEVDYSPCDDCYDYCVDELEENVCESCEYSSILHHLYKHIADDYVAVVMVMKRCESARDVAGMAYAVNNAGEMVALYLDDIYYEQARKLGRRVTLAY